MIIHGNSLEIIKEYPNNYFDSIVTDPPYGLSFMGKKWDYDVPSTELWAECLRVLKPGGYLLAFAGTRTQHRMAVRIEDAGFEIRDMIAWVYGSGFPKSLNIGKAVDKLQGNNREVTGYDTNTAPDLRDVGAMSKESTGIDKLSFGQNPRPAERKQIEITKGNSPYEGWGTALKPALEPITVARKPISEKNIAENVLKWGTGGINIDKSRVEYTGTTDPRTFGGSWKTDKAAQNVYEGGYEGIDQMVSPQGRFPANLIYDGSDEVVGLFPDSKGWSSQNNSPTNVYGGNALLSSKTTLPEHRDGYNDNGSAARFFYCAKASKSERNKGLEGFESRTVNDGRDTPIDNAFQRGETPRANVHPTVKPVALMRYLVKLVTPVNGTVLDPFNGSGTTGIAAKLENFDYIGIEREEEYVKISEARIAAWQEPQKKLL